MSKTIFDRVLEAQRDFRKQHSREPMVVKLSLEDEANLARLGWDQLGTVLEPILRHGVRKALPSLYGMRVEYDAKHFSLE